MFRKLLDEARAGDNVGLLLRGMKKDDVERGQVIAKPGIDQAPQEVQGRDLRALARKKADVTRRSSTNYRPQFYFRTTDVTGTVKLPEGVEMVMPGDNVAIEVELDHPDRHGEDHPLRHPRGRQDRRRRSRVRDSRL